MKSRDLIIKTARRLDKFNLDELIVVSELDEKEVTEILSDLIKQQIILKNNNTYFFNTKKSAEITNNDGDETISEFSGGHHITVNGYDPIGYPTGKIVDYIVTANPAKLSKFFSSVGYAATIIPVMHVKGNARTGNIIIQ